MVRSAHSLRFTRLLSSRTERSARLRDSADGAATYLPLGMSRSPRWQALWMAAAIEVAIVVAMLTGAARHVQHDEPVLLSVNLMTPTGPPGALPPIAKPDAPPPRATSLSLR